MGNTVVIIKARMGSNRLPEKVMKELFGQTVLAYDIKKVKQATLIDNIVVTTTVAETDDNRFT